MTFPWLTVLLLLPLVGGVLVALLPNRAAAEAPKRVAIAISLVVLVYSAVLALQFDSGERMQFTETHSWIASFGAHYALGLDGVGLSLVLLTTILTPIVMLASWHDADLHADGTPRASTKGFFAWMLVLEALALGCFVAVDVLLFYILFEAVLLPVYFLVGQYGGANRAKAATKFLLFSLAGGLIMMAGVIGVYVQSSDIRGGPTFLLTELTAGPVTMDTGVTKWLFIAFFIAFAIKAPLFPVHTWLPDTCEEGTPGTNTLLVSVLDKIGSFGMIRFCLELFPDASKWATPVVITLAVVSIIYGALMAIGSDNMMRLVAYTSVSHFGFIVLGIFVMNSQGLQGANLYMFAHGLSTAAIFLTCGFLMSRRGSALISDFGGVDKVAPVLAGLFLVANLSLLSLPGLFTFVPEFLVIAGAMIHSAWAAAFAVTGIVLAAVYALWMYQRVATGPTKPEMVGFPDLGRREIAALAPIVLLLVLLGFFPKPLNAVFDHPVEHTLSQVDKSDPAPTVGDAEEAAK